jgi:hypothetical protein
MRPDDLREYCECQPVQPFRFHLSSGAFFDIHQPKMVHIGRSTLTIGFPLEANLQRFAVIALVHIVWIEILLPAP